MGKSIFQGQGSYFSAAQSFVLAHSSSGFFSSSTGTNTVNSRANFTAKQMACVCQKIVLRALARSYSCSAAHGVKLSHGFQTAEVSWSHLPSNTSPKRRETPLESTAQATHHPGGGLSHAVPAVSPRCCGRRGQGKPGSVSWLTHSAQLQLEAHTLHFNYLLS